ncbi:hypothetical protein K491DRAFT_360885 [Lophiostoma macrostomum CBS 122681]|uniref:Uncharacterized protein n=1 Tax=Lophiostoma macrostomum CBS 122681 TaxID=1314788 RepID=A0A6A6TC26_9PLEO|nr:hypothetical protein K491DRAFT_360885 [Lophiostoma macrostomum CBS 122681]
MQQGNPAPRSEHVGTRRGTTGPCRVYQKSRLSAVHGVAPLRRRRGSSINSTRCCHPVLAKPKSKKRFQWRCFASSVPACPDVANPDLGVAAPASSESKRTRLQGSANTRPFWGTHSQCRRPSYYVRSRRRCALCRQPVARGEGAASTGQLNCTAVGAHSGRRWRASVHRVDVVTTSRPLRRQKPTTPGQRGLLHRAAPNPHDCAAKPQLARYLRRRIDLQLAGRRDPGIRLRSLQGVCGLESLISNRDYFGIECPGRLHMAASSIKASSRPRILPFPFEHHSRVWYKLR